MGMVVDRLICSLPMFSNRQVCMMEIVRCIFDSSMVRLHYQQCQSLLVMKDSICGVIQCHRGQRGKGSQAGVETL